MEYYILLYLLILQIGTSFSYYYTLPIGYQSNDIACPQATGQFNHPKYCDLFINCWDWTPTIDKCQNGLVFNQNKIYCDYPKNVDCQGRGLSRQPMLDPKCREPFGIYPNPSNCSEYYSCNSGQVSVMECPNSTYFDEDLNRCIYSPQPPSNCVDLHPCNNPSTPGCPPISAGTPTQPPSSTLPLKPKPSLDPSPSYPNPSQPQFEQPIQKPDNNQPTNQPDEISTVNFKPKPPLKPQNPTNPQETIVPGEIQVPEEGGEEPSKPPPPPPLKPGNFKPIKPGGPPTIGGPTPPNTTQQPDGEDDPNVLFPFLPTIPSIFKCPIRNGIFPIIGDCDKMIACINSEVHLMRCPHGDLFDIKLKRCVKDTNSFCKYNRKELGQVMYVGILASELKNEN